MLPLILNKAIRFSLQGPENIKSDNWHGYGYICAGNRTCHLAAYPVWWWQIYHIWSGTPWNTLEHPGTLWDIWPAKKVNRRNAHSTTDVLSKWELIRDWSELRAHWNILNKKVVSSLENTQSNILKSFWKFCCWEKKLQLFARSKILYSVKNKITAHPASFDRILYIFDWVKCVFSSENRIFC